MTLATKLPTSGDDDDEEEMRTIFGTLKIGETGVS